MADPVFTRLERPPEYRGNQSAESYALELSRWALKYHLTLQPLLRDAMQRLANVAGVAQLTQAISNPPTQDEVRAIQSKVNEVITSATET